MTTLLTLPSELTIKIFTTVIVDSGDVPPQPVVLLLASICKTLRELVLSSPTLWSRIRLRTFNDLESAPLFIQRSKECLLEVSLSFHRDLVPDITETRFFDVIAANMARWRKLTIRGPTSSEVKTFLQEIIDAPTPSLMEVFLLPSEHAACDEDHRPLLSGASDALRALTMRGCISCLAPFPNLTKLNIFRLNCNYEEFRSLIQGSPNLATLILGELQDTFPTVTVMEPIVSHRPLIEALSLHYFAVGFANSEPVEAYGKPLLASLSMPNLHYLEVVGSRVDYGELSGKLFPALKKLCLRDMNFPASSAALYRSFTTITSLELYFVQGARLLTAPDEDGKTPWPHLQTLRCVNWDERDCPWLELLEGRPQLTVELPIEHKDMVPAISNDHDVRFFSDESSGLIRVEDFMRADEEEDWTDSDYSADGDDWDYEYGGMEDEVDEEDYSEDEDGLEGVEGWY